MGRELEALPGVARVQMVRNARIIFRQTPVMIVAIEMASIAETSAPRRRSPATLGEMYREAAAGEGLMVSDNLAQLQQLTLGEVLEIPAPARRHPAADRRHRRRLLGPAGHDPDGSQRVHQQYWHDDSVNVFRVYLQPGADRPGRQATDPGALRRPAAGVRADERRAEELHPEESPISGSA